MAARRKRSRAGPKAHPEFVSEVEEIVERMRQDLSRLAEQNDGAGHVEPELVNGLFRSAHSLKGISGMFGLGGMSELAHHLENLLDRLRLGRATLDQAALGLFDEAVTLICTTLEKVGDGDAEAAAEETIADLIVRIDAWSGARSQATADRSSLDLAPAFLRALTEYEEHRLRENMTRGRTILVVEAEFEILSFEDGLARISSGIRESGELLSTLPSPGESSDTQIRFALLAASDESASELAERLGLPAERVRTAWRAGPIGKAEATPSPSPTATVAAGSETGRQPEARPTASEPASLKSISGTVRVDIRKLDELMNLVGELGLQRGALESITARLASQPDTVPLATELEKIRKSFARKLQELQSGVLEARMVPLRQVFEKLARVVRRLRVDSHKDVNLEISGADTELDKLIVEELIDPLMHVVRNAFDHGIESADERMTAGKPVEGRIRIEANQRGNDVVIAVSDDGRGIDTDVVARLAREKGLISRDAELSRKDLLELLFAPSFTTRSEVTETSGRGVGMDVVRANIAALGGIVGLDSTIGVGTTVTMTLPITLAIMQTLIVGVGNERFAVPLNSVRETLLVDPDDIQRSDGREMLNLRGDPLLLRRLCEEFHLEDADRRGKQYAVVLGVGEWQLGLLVDRLEGRQDTVIKPIQGPARSARGIAGATEWGEQGAVLVLDVCAVVEDAIHGREGA